MKIGLSRLTPKIHHLTRHIGRQADRQKSPAYLVGGIIRDLILKRPNMDIDIVVEGDAIGLARALKPAFKARLTSYPQFLTATLQLPDGLHVDFATCRRERYPYPGALPVVERGSIQDDLFRRDFSINAMAACVNQDRWGELVDFYDGFKDLKAGKVRVLYEKSFRDDPTRMLRAVRFEQRFGFRLERMTGRRLKEAFEQRLDRKVKLPRYFNEFQKILCEPAPWKGIRRLQGLGGLQFLGLRDRIGDSVLRTMQRVDGYLETIKTEGGACPQRWLIYLLFVIGQMSEERRAQLAASVNLQRAHRLAVLDVHQAAHRFDRLPPKATAYDIHRLCRPLAEEVLVHTRLTTKSLRLKKAIDRYFTETRNIKVKLGGRDLMALGVYSGKRMADLFEKILEAKINGDIRTVNQERKMAKQLARANTQ